MSFIPDRVAITYNSYDVLNAIRNSATENYRNNTNPVTNVNEFNELGVTLTQMPNLCNEFINTLWNKLIFAVVRYRSYTNPWAMFKKGIVEMGEIIEEIFPELCKVHDYNPERAESEMLKRELPEVKTAFHKINYQKMYKLTISQQDISKAFTSVNAMDNFIETLIARMYDSVSLDEFETMRYMLARRILNGLLYVESIDTTDIKNSIAKIKATSNKATFMNTKYNLFGVNNHLPVSEQVIIVSADFDANVDVNVLAGAFNLPYADFLQRRILVDGFGNVNDDRLEQLFGNEDWYTPLTSEEKELLNNIPCVLTSEQYFMIYDNLFVADSFTNPEGLYTNRWLHIWKLFSVSPFETAIVFHDGTTAVSSITISGTETLSGATINEILTANGVLKLDYTAEVVTSGFASKAVNWSVSEMDGVEITNNGTLIIRDVPSGNITITATSVDGTKTATKTLTITSEV